MNALHPSADTLAAHPCGTRHGVLDWILRQRGAHLVHGAAVGRGNRTVLLVGPGGSGKSTTAVRAAAAGMNFIGDDYVAFSCDPPTVHHVFATAKLHPDVDPGEFDSSHRPGDEKAVLRVPEAMIKSSMPLSAIATLRITGTPDSNVEPTSHSHVRASALNTTLEQIPHPDGLEVALDTLLSEIPSGQIAIGSDTESLIGILDEVLEDPSQLHTREEDTEPPLISVVIPVHNGAEFIAEAIDSVLKQNYSRLEIVVVDDGSTDDLISAIAAFDVTLIQQSQKGPSAARNAGIAASKGEIVAFLDVDDVWPAGRLEALLFDLTSSGSDVALGCAQVVRRTEDGTWERFGAPETSFPWYIGAALYRREVFEHVGGFDEGMRYAEDIDWFARLQAHPRPLRRVSYVTLEVRRHGANMTEGRDLVELHVVRAVKKALDRKRQQAQS